MKNTLTKTILFCLLLLTFSCAKKTEYLVAGEDASSEHPFIRAKVNGKLVECEMTNATLYNETPKVVIITGSKGTEIFSFDANDFKGVGTYNLNNGDATYSIISSSNLVTYVSTQGTLKITSSTDKIITGTFEFTAKNLGDNSERTITEGAFSVNMDTFPTSPEPNPSTYYLSLKVDNKAVNLDSQTALRGQVNGNNTLSIQASANDNKNPKLSFYHPGSFIGIEKGLNIVGFGKDSDSELKYTNESGKEYSTKLDDDGGYFTILDVKYENGGYVKGVFSGSLTSSDNSKIRITEGSFKVQFSN